MEENKVVYDRILEAIKPSREPNSANRTYNLSVKSGIVKPGKSMISKEYRGAKRTIWSLFGAQFGEEFGEALLLN